jgi:hypothetical protein
MILLKTNNNNHMKYWISKDVLRMWEIPLQFSGNPFKFRKNGVYIEEINS